MNLKIPLLGETENWRPKVYFDAKYVSAHFCRTKTPWIAIWGNIFIFGRKLGFSVFPPIGQLRDYSWAGIEDSIGEDISEALSGEDSYSEEFAEATMEAK